MTTPAPSLVDDERGAEAPLYPFNEGRFKGGNMKAIRVHQFGGPEVLKLEEVPDPVAGPGQVVIDVKAIGRQPGRELTSAPEPTPPNRTCRTLPAMMLPA